MHNLNLIKNEQEAKTQLSLLQLALWYDAQNNWKQAHAIAQSKEGEFDYDRIHAYLHRKEGDLFNAKWWYKKLKIDFPTITLEQEWEQLSMFYRSK